MRREVLVKAVYSFNLEAEALVAGERERTVIPLVVKEASLQFRLKRFMFN